MSPKIKTKKDTVKRQNPEVSQNAVKILRNVDDKEAFHFYENIGKPTGQSAKNLPEFLNRINTIKLGSLQFHLERKDFQNWFKETLGDPELAQRMERIASTNDERLRVKIHEIVEQRLNELRDTGITIEVREELELKH